MSVLGQETDCSDHPKPTGNENGKHAVVGAPRRQIDRPFSCPLPAATYPRNIPPAPWGRSKAAEVNGIGAWLDQECKAARINRHHGAHPVQDTKQHGEEEA